MKIIIVKWFSSWALKQVNWENLSIISAIESKTKETNIFTFYSWFSAEKNPNYAENSYEIFLAGNNLENSATIVIARKNSCISALHQYSKI